MLDNIPFVAGLLLALSLAAPPGPANAMIANEAVRRSWTAGWLTGLGAVTGDLTMLTLTALGTLRLLDLVPWLTVVLAYAGAVLMAKFGWDAWQAARAPMALASRSGVGTFVSAYVVVMTSPFNFAWWLTGGTTLLTHFGVAGTIGFFGGLLLWITTWSALARAGARRIERFSHFVSYASAVVLVVFAGWVAKFAIEGTLALWA